MMKLAVLAPVTTDALTKGHKILLETSELQTKAGLAGVRSTSFAIT